METNEVLLSISNVYKSFKGFKALNGINIDIYKGDFIALLGPNGAGKSTLINILNSCTNKDSGEVTLKGYDLEKDSKQFKLLLGVVPQEIMLDQFFTPLSILLLQQGYYGYKPSKEKAYHYLDLLGLKGKEKSSIRSLSGGMKRRVAVAQALITNPELIILDEPTAGVDVDLRTKLWGVIRDIHKSGTTVIITTHYLEEAEQLCNKTIIMKHGQVLVQKKTSDLLVANQRTVSFNLSAKYEDLPSNIKSAVKWCTDKKIFSINVSNDQSIVDFFYECKAQSIEVSNINITTTSLEDVFLEMTHLLD